MDTPADDRQVPPTNFQVENVESRENQETVVEYLSFWRRFLNALTSMVSKKKKKIHFFLFQIFNFYI